MESKGSLLLSVRLILTYSISLILLMVLLNKVDVRAVSHSFTKVPLWAYSISVALYITAFVVSTIRWRIFIDDVPFALLLRWSFISQFFATVIPGQIGGDVMQIYGLRKNGIRSSISAASIIINRVSGLAALMVVVNVALILSANRSSVPQFLVTGSLGVLACTVLFFVLSITLGKKCKPIAGSRGRGLLFNLVLYINETIIALWQSGRNTSGLIFSFLLSFLFHLLSIGKIAIIAQALIPGVSFIDWCWIGGMVSVATIFPLSAGGLGVREGGFAALLVLLSVTVENALALSLTLYSIQLIGALGGFILYMYETGRIKKRIVNDDVPEVEGTLKI